jgi:hypothetical protein
MILNMRFYLNFLIELRELQTTFRFFNELNKIYCNFQKINFEVKDITTSIAMTEAGVLVVCIIKIA